MIHLLVFVFLDSLLSYQKIAFKVFFIFTVYPHIPTSVKVKDINSTAVTLSWHLPGNFAKVKLLCEIEINTTNSIQELVSKTLL